MEYCTTMGLNDLHSNEQNKPDTNKYVLYDSVYVQFKNRQN